MSEPTALSSRAGSPVRRFFLPPAYCSLPTALWVVVFLFAGVKNLAVPGSHTVYPMYAKAARELAAGGAPAATISYQHLPYFAGVVAGPFAALPNRYGGTLWGFASLIVLATGLRAFADRFAPGGPRGYAVFLSVALAAGIGSLGNNQSNLLITGCLCWGAVLVRDRRWWAAAVVLALPGFKLYPLALGLVYAALYPRQFAVRFAGAAAGWWLLPFLFYPAGAIHDRVATVGVYVTSGVHSDNYPFLGLRESFARYGLVIGPGAYFPVQALAGAVIPVLLWRLRRRGADDRELIARGAVLTLLWCVVLGPSVEPQTYLLAGPALGLLAAGWRGHLSRAGLILVIATAAVCGPLQTDLLGPAARVAVTGSKAACGFVTLVFIWQLVRTARDGGGRVVYSPITLTSTRLGRLPSNSP